jgi:hypothetical protein
MTNVPIVEINLLGREALTKVEVSVSSSTYLTGSTIDLPCTDGGTPLCRENNVVSLWYASAIALVGTVGFTCVGFVFRWESL